ncbi:ParM/StbA family protein [Paenibacillus larvae]|uniref:Plasmid segregation protein ParM n=1 Tax=Paenibacillus larvae subsp. larvae TaxID=147375 RepID=A0A6C0QZ66_9BACL|nr:ParM/StbA family protein [Paenibacillus larvae]QHZ54025.1 plasmid segregation protein ParM [Paenibacillus larvae subsp. larvae]
MLHIIGIESANSYLKAKSAKQELCYINTTRKLKPKEIGMFSPFPQVFNYQGTAYVTSEPYGNSSSGVDIDRYKTEQFKREIIFAVAQLVSSGDEVQLVTGLPVEDMHDQDIENVVKENLKGSHEVMINADTKTFNIIDVKAIEQPLASLVYYMLDDKGKLRPERKMFESKRLLIIDIGFGTTDVVETVGLNPMKMKGIGIGLRNAMSDLEDLVKIKYPRIQGMPRGIELDYEIRHASKILCGGETYDIKAEKEQAFQDTADRIIEGVKDAGFAIKSYDRVVFTGGGTLALREHLRDHLEGANAVLLNHSQMANAYGYYIYGGLKYNG